MNRTRCSVLAVFAGPASVAAAGLLALALTWATQPDPFIDTGRECYIPWQLLSGKVLYRDIAYFNGPLSPYLNAMLFGIGGVHLTTLLVSNAGIIAGVAVVLYRLLLRLGDRLSAAVGGVFFVTVFAFGYLHPIGIFNWIIPYSHEMTHGVALSLASIWCLGRYQRSPSLPFLAAAGLLGGLVLLTKVEIGLALVAALGAGLGLTLWRRRVWMGKSLVAIAISIFGLALPASIAWIMLSRSMPAVDAFQGVLGSWRYAGMAEIRRMPFYQITLGADDASGNLLNAALSAGVQLLLLAPALIAAFMLRRAAKQTTLIVAAGAALLGTAALLPLLNGGRPLALLPLPFVLLLILVSLVRQVWRRRTNSESSELEIEKLTFVIFSLMLLAKMILNVRISQYGFALAMPGMMVLITLLVHDLPAAISNRGGKGAVFLAGSLAALAAFLGCCLQVTATIVGGRTIAVSTPTASFWCDGRGDAVNEAVDFLSHRTRPEDSLAVVPEGVMLNFLTQRVNPTPYVSLIPVEVSMFGEQKILAAFQKTPPEFIAVVHRNTEEYGARFFGKDYGRLVWRWILDHYAEADLIGEMPNRDVDHPGILILKRTR